MFIKYLLHFIEKSVIIYINSLVILSIIGVLKIEQGGRLLDKKYNYEMGKVYDTLFYMTMYFHESDFLTLLRQRGIDELSISDGMRLYFEFKKNHKEIVLPLEIAPFFYADYQVGRSCFVISAIRRYLDIRDNSNGSVVEFFQDKKLFEKMFWEYYFPQKNDNVAKQIVNKDFGLSIAEVISQLNVLDDVKPYFVAMAYNFEMYQEKLIDTFKSIYPLVCDSHSKHQYVFDEIKEQITDNTVDKLKDIFKLPSDISSITIYFSTFNHCLLDYRVDNDNDNGERCFGLGSSFIIQMGEVESPDLKFVSLHTMSKALCNETRMDILDMFLTYKRLCAGDIAHKLQIAKSTVYLHLNVMISEEMVVYTEDSPRGHGERAFFSVNPDYFNAITTQVSDINLRASNIILKGIDKYERPKSKRNSKL